MSSPITAATQADLDAAVVANSTVRLQLRGDGGYYISVGQPHIEVGEGRPYIWAGDASQPHIEVGDTSQPRIEVQGTSQPHIEVQDASQPHIEVTDVSQPRIVGRGAESPARVIAYGDAHLVVEGHVEVHAAPGVYILATPGVVITGGHVRRRQSRDSVEVWCDYYGVPIIDGVVTLYKAVRDNYRSARDLCYAPGTFPVAADWDGGGAECGGGLHFCARPLLAQGFDPEATRFVACPVAVVDLRVPRAGDVYPNKIKARAVCGPVVEVDEFGDPLEAR